MGHWAESGAQAGHRAAEAAGPGQPGAAQEKPQAGAAAQADESERARLEEAGRAALARLPETSAADANKTPGNVGQGTIGESQELPDWFKEIQSRLVASTVWGEAEENAQHAIRDYAMFVARRKSKDGKVPSHIKAFFDYIGRGTKNDEAARKAGYKGTSALTGGKGAKNWCAGAATNAQRIGKKEGREAVLADLRGRGLEPSCLAEIFFSNLARLSGSQKTKTFYNNTAFAEPLEPGDRVDYLFDHCQYGGHAVHIVADMGDSFLHVSGNTTRHSAVATGQAKRLKTKPEGLDMSIANNVTNDETKARATQHIAKFSFGGGALIYMIQRYSDPYKALEMLETEDSKEFEAALKKLMLRRLPQGGGEAPQGAAAR
jgi:hypothetical protein